MKKKSFNYFLVLISVVLFGFVFVKREKEQNYQKTKSVTILYNSGNQKIDNFEKAKKLAYKIYEEHPYTLYCNCFFQKTTIDHQSCNYTPFDNEKRAKRLEWEHIVPASLFGQKTKAWKIGHNECEFETGKKYKGRKCAKKVSPDFRRMEADLYNLVPAVGEVNAIRGNIPMGDKSLGNYKQVCDLRIYENKIVPHNNLKGFIGRTYLYMNSAYQEWNLLSEDEVEVFSKWNQKFPADSWEKKRAKIIAKIQGNANPYYD